MKNTRVWIRSALVVIAAPAAVAALAPARAANCTCYYASDCAEGQYCNWQDACTRHCELQGTWEPEWGAPPQSTPECDSWIGACHDNEPDPPDGSNGDGENCQPPHATPPGGGPEMDFKMRDGVCNTRKVKKVEGPTPHGGGQDVERATGTLLDLLEAGGGEVHLNIADPYLRDVVYNLEILAVGLYDFQSNANGNPTLTDLRSEPCAEQAISALGAALTTEIRGHGRGSPHQASAAEMFATMSPTCQTWMETRSHNCQFPHPHAHHFDYENGLECIADNIRAMAESLFPKGPASER